MAAPKSYITIKQAEISIKKFNEIGIPHHLGLLKNHKSNIEKSLPLSDWDKVKKEEINATRVIKQLKNLMLEMDILRGNVEEINLDKFDELTSIGRKKVKEAIKEYLDLQLKITSLNTSKMNNGYLYPEDDEQDDQFGLEDLPQIQAEFQLSEHQLRSREACLAEVENLQREIEDIQGLFFQLNEHVVIQGDNIEAAEDNISQSKVHVEQAEKSLRQALTYKKAMYPLCGAILGFCVAGPIGMVSLGLKAGSLVAVGCGVLGATGGSALKNKQEFSPNDMDPTVSNGNNAEGGDQPKCE